MKRFAAELLIQGDDGERQVGMVSIELVEARVGSRRLVASEGWKSVESVHASRIQNRPRDDCDVIPV